MQNVEKFPVKEALRVALRQKMTDRTCYIRKNSGD